MRRAIAPRGGRDLSRPRRRVVSGPGACRLAARWRPRGRVCSHANQLVRAGSAAGSARQRRAAPAPPPVAASARRSRAAAPMPRTDSCRLGAGFASRLSKAAPAPANGSSDVRASLCPGLSRQVRRRVTIGSHTNQRAGWWPGGGARRRAGAAWRGERAGRTGGRRSRRRSRGVRDRRLPRTREPHGRPACTGRPCPAARRFAARRPAGPGAIADPDNGCSLLGRPVPTPVTRTLYTLPPTPTNQLPDIELTGSPSGPGTCPQVSPWTSLAHP